MRSRYLILAAAVHAALIVALVLVVHPVFAKERLVVPPIYVAATEPFELQPDTRPEPPKESAQAEESPPVEEQEVVPPEPEPKTVLVEPVDVPPSHLPPNPDLLLRVRTVVVQPPRPEVKETEVEREQRLEPKAPQDYVQNLQLDRRNKPPKYPVLARRQGVEGDLVVAVMVGLEGRAKKIRIHTSAGVAAPHQKMDKAALRALWKWHYPVVMSGGVAVEIEVRVPVVFRLR